MLVPLTGRGGAAGDGVHRAAGGAVHVPGGPGRGCHRMQPGVQGEQQACSWPPGPEDPASGSSAGFPLWPAPGPAPFMLWAELLFMLAHAHPRAQPMGSLPHLQSSSTQRPCNAWALAQGFPP